jgi:hypothetical protein
MTFERPIESVEPANGDSSHDIYINFVLGRPLIADKDLFV